MDNLLSPGFKNFLLIQADEKGHFQATVEGDPAKVEKGLEEALASNSKLKELVYRALAKATTITWKNPPIETSNPKYNVRNT